MTDIGALVRTANPVPVDAPVLSDDELDALLLVIEARNGDMDLKEITTPVEHPRPPARRWLVAVAAFAAVLLVGVAIAVLQPAGGETAPAAPTETTVVPTTTVAPPTTAPVAGAQTTRAPELTAELLSLAAEYEKAFNEGDEAGLSALLSESFGPYQPAFLWDLTMSREDFLAYNQLVHLRGGELSIEGCKATDYGMRCEFVHSGPVEVAVYGAPWRVNNAIHVEDGRIAGIESQIVAWPHIDLQDAVIAWVKTINPDDGAKMGRLDPGTEEDAPLWLEYAPRWVEAGRP